MGRCSRSPSSPRWRTASARQPRSAKKPNQSFGSSEAAIDRIVSAVDHECSNGIDRDGLRDALHEIRMGKLSRSTEQLAVRKRRAREIATQASDLASALENSGDRLLDYHLSWEIDGRGELIAMLRHLSEVAEAGGDLGVRSGASKRWLVEQLAAVWLAHFRRDPGVSRAPEGGQPYGPFVRFVQATATEIGESISAETIADGARSSHEARGSVS